MLITIATQHNTILRKKTGKDQKEHSTPETALCFIGYNRDIIINLVKKPTIH